MHLLFFKSYKKRSRVCMSIALSKHVTHHCPWSGFPFFMLTIPPIERVPPLCHPGTCLAARCGFMPWKTSPIHNMYYHILYKFPWKSCIFIGLQDGDILVCHPPELVTIGLSVTLLCARVFLLPIFFIMTHL